MSTALTGVPLRVRSGRLPAPNKLAGWLTEGGRPLTVAAVEEGPAQLFVVRAAPLGEIAEKMGSVGLKGQRGRFDMQLGHDDQTRFVQPVPQRVEGSGELTDLFDVSPFYTAGDGGLPYTLKNFGRLASSLGSKPAPEAIRIADAVAVAGLEAMTENRRRAVLLVLSGDETHDASGYRAETVAQLPGGAARAPVRLDAEPAGRGISGPELGIGGRGKVGQPPPDRGGSAAPRPRFAADRHGRRPPPPTIHPPWPPARNVELVAGASNP